jgi:adenylate cyclase
MGGRRSRNQIVLLLCAGVLSAAVVAAAYEAQALNSLELRSVDLRFAIRGPLRPPKDVVIVGIDNLSFNEFQQAAMTVRWPWPRGLFARVIDHIAAGHPTSIELAGLNLAYRNTTDPAGDRALIASLAKAHDAVVDVLRNYPFFGGSTVLQATGARQGTDSFGLISDSDGVLRQVPRSIGGLMPTGIAIASVAEGHPVRWPGGGPQWIDFSGPPGTVQEYPFADVYGTSLDRVSPRVFHHKIVIVGMDSTLLDAGWATSVTAGKQWMQSAEVDANIAATALAGFPLRDPPVGVGLGLIVFLGLLPALLGLRLRPQYTFAVVLLVGWLFAYATQIAFDHGSVLPFTYPLVALALAMVTSLLVWYVLATFERTRTRDAFARFVPAKVVDEVLARTGGELRLGGETVVGTVMFTDLRGFTTFAEQLDAQQVIGVLNRYLTEMSDAILVHGGTLVSYIGDGILAVFGAPLEQPDHADRALASAREMLETRLPAFNEWLNGQGFEAFEMGIGLNSGPFMSGNVGSQRRLEYTAIGDTTNTASRVEAMTKDTPYSLMLTESTRDALVHDAPDLIYVDESAVRGRTARVKLWTLEFEAPNASQVSKIPAEDVT